MTRRIYPLNSLRAFEASARHLSFVKAADELFVTPAAISQQVKLLEEYLGLQLFRRQPRGLILGEAGQILLPELREAFLRLDKAIEKVLESDSRGALTISVAPMFTVKWLLPRLQKFDTLFPNIDVRISSSMGLVDFQRDNFDIAIRLGNGKYPGLRSIKLFDESASPMCSPKLLEGKNAIRSLDDLRRHVLLHNDSLGFDTAASSWDKWLKAVGARQTDTSRGPHFSQPDHALQAAIDGAGVVLGWQYLAADDLAAGRLVEPFNLALPLEVAFYLVYPEAYADRPKVVAFRNWLIEEIKDSQSNSLG